MNFTIDNEANELYKTLSISIKINLISNGKGRVGITLK